MRIYNEKLKQLVEIIEKYMFHRGNLSQKNLADRTGIGVATVSRLLNLQIKNPSDQDIVKIVARLNIPMSEVIDFIYADDQDEFINLVKFYKTQMQTDKETEDEKGPIESGGDPSAMGNINSEKGTAYKEAIAHVSIGNNPKRALRFINENESTTKKNDKTLGEKMQTLTPRQRKFLSDFLDLDLEGRDLMVDVGTALFNYFDQKGLDY